MQCLFYKQIIFDSYTGDVVAISKSDPDNKCPTRFAMAVAAVRQTQKTNVTLVLNLNDDQQSEISYSEI